MIKDEAHHDHRGRGGGGIEGGEDTLQFPVEKKSDVDLKFGRRMVCTEPSEKMMFCFNLVVGMVCLPTFGWCLW